MLRQVEVFPFCQSFREVCFYLLKKARQVILSESIKHTDIHNYTETIASTHLIIRSSPVNTMDDIDVDTGKSFSKSEKLERDTAQG